MEFGSACVALGALRSAGARELGSSGARGCVAPVTLTLETHHAAIELSVGPRHKDHMCTDLHRKTFGVSALACVVLWVLSMQANLTERERDTLAELALRATYAAVGEALRAHRWRLARALSDIAWTVAHAREHLARGDTRAARAALSRAQLLVWEVEALECGNAVDTCDEVSGVRRVVEPDDAPTLPHGARECVSV